MTGSRLPVLLVNPSSRLENYGVLNDLSAIEPPLWCALLAGWIRQSRMGVEILDAEVENLTVRQTAKAIVEHNPLLAVIVVMGINPSVSSTPKMDAVKALVRDIRLIQADAGRRIKVMLAGLHPSALPQQTIRETGADYVCQGEGFYTIMNTAAALRNNDEPRNIPGLWWWWGEEEYHIPQRPPAPASLITPTLLGIPAWDLLPMTRYRAHNWHCLGHLDQRVPYGVIATSLGCPFSCSYCPVHTIYGGDRVVRYRTVYDIMHELDMLVAYGIRNIKFWDEMFALNERRVLQICDAIIQRRYNLNIWAYGRTSTTTPLMIEAMKKAGIHWICYGFESADPAVRAGVNKKTTEDEFTRTVDLCRQNDVNIIANYLLGLPDDTMETMEATMKQAQEANFEWLNVYCTAPMPGSQLYLDTLGLERPRTWAGYSQFSPGFKPLPTKTVPGHEVLAFRDRAFQEYFSRPEYLEVIERKFGPAARLHVLEMLKTEVKRDPG